MAADQNRITRISVKLYELWSMNPDMSFAQLVMAATRYAGVNDADVRYLDDVRLEQVLNEYMENQLALKFALKRNRHEDDERPGPY